MIGVRLVRYGTAGLLFVLMVIAGCSPTARGSLEELPTVAVLPPTPDTTYTLEAAERVASNFLENWRRGDYEAMYDLISFASREAMSFDNFRTLYEGAGETMTLEGLTFQGNTLFREQHNLAIFNYDAVFDTFILGTFADQGRNLRLVIDQRAGAWRVAWTPGAIFAEMAGGAGLRLERIIPSRANIYDRDGLVLADQNGRAVTVNVIKQNIPQPEACLNALAQVVGDPVDEVRDLLGRSGADWLTEVGLILPQSYLDNRAWLEQVCDARFDDRATRRYVNGSIAPHIVGTVGFPDEDAVDDVVAAGFDPDSIIGKSGIERTWDETLRGQPGGRLVISSSGEGILRVIASSRSQPAESVWLTLDSDLQAFVYDVIAAAYQNARESWAPGSKGAAAVVLDVNTGEILAMVSFPAYDANLFVPFPPVGEVAAEAGIRAIQQDPRRPQLNRATLGEYPLGSVMKTVSTIAVADSGVYSYNQRYNCAGVWNRDIPRFDWLPGGHGVLTLSQAITQSCNSYFYEVGYQLDQADPFILPTYARRIGLGVPTGLRDLAESPGNIPDPDWVHENTGLNWTFSDSVNTAVGQGYVQVTPLQVARIFSAYANGGTLYRPQLVQKVGILGEAPSFVSEPEVMSEFGVPDELVELLQDALCQVTTNPQGTATHIFRGSELQSIGVCGKTGTAQAPGEGVPPHAWFAAFAPREFPEVAVAVVVENAGEGSAVAAPLVREILEYYFFGN